MLGTSGNNSWSPFISYLHQRFAKLPNLMPAYYVDVNSIQLNLNHGLGNLNKWLTSNKLTLNTAKSEFMLIGSRKKLSTLSSQPELSIDNVPIEKVTYVKSLAWNIY